uniref:Uncharacterized protein n=1 Tax=Panagrolaimus sp. JU765 TaxID=591449 RepID=A0AC34QQJ9_9BILA
MGKKSSSKKKYKVKDVNQNIDNEFIYDMPKSHKKYFHSMKIKMAKGLITNDMKTTTDTALELLDFVWSNKYFDYKDYCDYAYSALSAAGYYYNVNDVDNLIKALHFARLFDPINPDYYVRLARVYIKQNQLGNAFMMKRCLEELRGRVVDAEYFAYRIQDIIFDQFTKEDAQKGEAIRNTKRLPVRDDKLLSIDRRQVINWFFLDDNDFIRDKFQEYSSIKYSIHDDLPDDEKTMSNVIIFRLAKEYSSIKYSIHDDLPDDEKTMSNVIIFRLAKGKFDGLLFDAFDAWKDGDEKEVCNYLFILLLYFHQFYTLSYAYALMYLQNFREQKNPDDAYHTMYNAVVTIAFCSNTEHELGPTKEITNITGGMLNDLTFFFRAAAHSYFFNDKIRTFALLSKVPKPTAEEFTKRPNDYKVLHVLKQTLDTILHSETGDFYFKFPLKDFKFPPFLIDVIMPGKWHHLTKELNERFESVLRSYYYYLPCYYDDSQMSLDDEVTDFYSAFHKADKFFCLGKIKECLECLKIALKMSKTSEELFLVAETYFKNSTEKAWINEKKQMDTNIVRFKLLQAANSGSGKILPLNICHVVQNPSKE